MISENALKQPFSDIAEPPHAGLLGIDADVEQYRLRNPLDVANTLQGIARAGCLLTVYFNGGNDYLPSTLFGITPNGKNLVLDLGPNKLMNQRAVEANDLVCVATVEKVRVQFEIKSLSLARYKGQAAFIAPMPASLIRIQRRSFYRLSPPSYPAPRFTIDHSRPDGSRTALSLRVNDISVGGISLSFPAQDLPVYADSILTSCRLELPEVGTLMPTLRVRNVSEQRLRNGAIQTRAGCQFLDLMSADEKLIQKYIYYTERHRQAKESGLSR